MTERRGISRRGFVGAAGLAGVSAAMAALGSSASAVAAVSGRRGEAAAGSEAAVPGANGALGANFNEYIDDIDISELEIGRDQWVRGFFPMPQAAQGGLAGNPIISTVRRIGGLGYRTVLTLKFPYNRTAVPAPGSPAMATVLAQVDKVLALVLNHVDVLEIGNEPFIESLPADQSSGALNAFYEDVARHIIDYRRAHTGPRGATRLYMGALNRLDLPDRRTAATERWMRFVRQTPEIEGVDIHPHVPSASAVQPFLDYVLPRLRADQTFLVTEFSLVWYWQAHMSDPVPAEFADRYGVDPATPVWRMIRAAIDQPFAQEKWNHLLSMSPWFESQKYFLRDQVERFRATGRLAVAAYGYRQGPSMVRDFGPGKPPWLLNTVFAPYTVRKWPNGTTGRGYAWIEEFRALQSGAATARRS